MKYMLAICAAMIMLAVLETCEKEAERAAFTVKPAQPDTLVLFKNDDVDPSGMTAAQWLEMNAKGSIIVLCGPGTSPLGDSSVPIFDKSNGEWQIESSLPVDVKSKQRGHKSSLEAAYELSDSLSRDYRARMDRADKELRETFPDVGWKRVREWSSVAGCSVLVALYYETPDSSLHIHCENPDTLHKRAGIRMPRRK